MVCRIDVNEAIISSFHQGEMAGKFKVPINISVPWSQIVIFFVLSKLLSAHTKKEG